MYYVLTVFRASISRKIHNIFTSNFVTVIFTNFHTVAPRVASFLHFLHDAKNVKAKNLSQKMGAKNAIKENYRCFHEFRLNLA